LTNATSHGRVAFVNTKWPDRLDDALSMLTRDERADIEASAVTMRDLLDGLEAEIDKRAVER
jgi:hypothetical protein